MAGALRSHRLERSGWVLILAALAALTAANVHAARIDGVRIHQAPEYTRVVFDISAAVGYSIFTLENPHRVVVDIKSSVPRDGFDVARVPTEGTLVTRLRAGSRDGAHRVVLDVPRAVQPKGFALKPVAPYGHRLVVDLYEQGGAMTSRRQVQPKDSLRDVVIAIDAGHGGEDPGAIGRGRVYEKRVVMGIAKELNALFDSAAGYEGVMVRTGDYYVPLKRRTQIAREKRADLLLSIHADAFKSPAARGASVYTLSDRGATSETARWLAEKENRADLIGGVGDVSLDNKDELLTQVLLSLSMDATRSASIEAGSSVLSALGGMTRLHKRQVEQAAFVVLKAPDVPSILIETGYLSNPEEARLLSQAGHQRKIARAIFGGVTAYLGTNPPPGSLLAHRKGKGGTRYVIRRGDTLSEIAEHYSVSARRLREANGLANDVIKVGQVLIIPAT